VPNSNASGGGVLLSTQTQLASLRGALEAARLREEKHKTELEKALKEMDVLRWEHANSRRGEVEVGDFVLLSCCVLLASISVSVSLFILMPARFVASSVPRPSFQIGFRRSE
jgi:hypothetical protein